MKALIVSFSIALVLTSIFAFRFRAWRKPWLLLGYFAFFQTIEGVAEYYFIPEGALMFETAAVCFTISGLFIAACVLVDRFGDAEEHD